MNGWMIKPLLTLSCPLWSPDVGSQNKYSVQFKAKNKALGSASGGRVNQDMRAGLGKLQHSTRSQKTKPERDKAILIDAFHVREVQVHSGWTLEFPVFKTFLQWSWNCTLSPSAGGLCLSGIIRHMRPSPHACVRTTETRELETTMSAGWGGRSPGLWRCWVCWRCEWVSSPRSPRGLSYDARRPYHVISRALSSPEILRLMSWPQRELQHKSKGIFHSGKGISYYAHRLSYFKIYMCIIY